MKSKAPQKRAVPFRCRLVIMVKEPTAGRVKTRLAGEIGVVRATWFYRHTVAAVVARLSRSGAWETILAVSPDTGVAHRFWPRTMTRMAQGRGDLGHRMQRLMHAQPPGPVVIIGTDIPSIRPRHIRAAFKALAGADAVFGPALDGGYWLVGQNRRPRELRMFDHVRWSSPNALTDTLRNLRGCDVRFVATLSDVDSAEDLRSAAAWCGRRVLPLHIAPVDRSSTE